MTSNTIRFCKVIGDPTLSAQAHILRRVAGLLTVIMLQAWRTLNAQEAQSTGGPPPVPPGGSEQEFAPANSFVPRPGNLARVAAAVDYSYVAAGDASFQGLKQSGSDAHLIHLTVAGAVPLDEHWFIPLGLSAGNLWLGSESEIPIPERINTLRLLTGVGYRINDQWTCAASVGPALYRLEEIDGDDIGVAGMVGALYRRNPTLTWAFGIAFNPRSDVPVLPAAGVRWEIQTNLTLNLMFPRPVLIYRLCPKLSLFGGGDFKFAVFRGDSSLGDRIGQPAFNNALGTYHDFHLGVGVEYEVAARLALTVEGGYSVGREIDYHALGQTVSFDPSPYCQVAMRFRF